MLGWTASVQPLLISVVLIWAGVVKLRGLTPQQAKQNALSKIVGEERTSAAWRLVGGVELAIAAGLLLPPAHPVKAGSAVLLTLGFLGYLGYARVAAPESGCGCLSARPQRISWRSFARAGLLAATALVTLVAADVWWGHAFTETPVSSGILLLGELAAFIALSVEFDRYWLVPLRKLKVRLTHPLAGAPQRVPLEHTVAQLQLSEAYRRIGASITSDVQDHWDEGDWRIVTYLLRQRDGKPATAVFAVPLDRYDPSAVRVALVDESRAEAALAQV